MFFNSSEIEVRYFNTCKYFLKLDNICTNPPYQFRIAQNANIGVLRAFTARVYNYTLNALHPRRNANKRHIRHI